MIYNKRRSKEFEELFHSKPLLRAKVSAWAGITLLCLLLVYLTSFSYSMTVEGTYTVSKQSPRMAVIRVASFPPGLGICEATIRPGHAGEEAFHIKKPIYHIEEGIADCKKYVEISFLLDQHDPVPLTTATNGTAKVVTVKEVFIHKLINDIKNRK